MYKLGTWGTQIEIQALSCLYQLEIYIYKPKRQGTGYEWTVFKSETIPKMKLKFPKAANADLLKHYHIELCNTLGIHYDRIVPQDLHLSVHQNPPPLYNSVSEPIVLED